MERKLYAGAGLLAEFVTLWRLGPCCGSVPEGLHPMERTQAGAVHIPGKTHLTEVHRGPSLWKAPCSGAGEKWEEF